MKNRGRCRSTNPRCVDHDQSRGHGADSRHSHEQHVEIEPASVDCGHSQPKRDPGEQEVDQKKPEGFVEGFCAHLAESFPGVIRSDGTIRPGDLEALGDATASIPSGQRCNSIQQIVEYFPGKGLTDNWFLLIGYSPQIWFDGLSCICGNVTSGRRRVPVICVYLGDSAASFADPGGFRALL
jgi:hypothetical protein